MTPAQSQEATAQGPRGQVPHRPDAELAGGDQELLELRQGFDGEEPVASGAQGVGRQLGGLPHRDVDLLLGACDDFVDVLSAPLAHLGIVAVPGKGVLVAGEGVPARHLLRVVHDVVQQVSCRVDCGWAHS